jgi:hypothetical protein
MNKPVSFLLLIVIIAVPYFLLSQVLLSVFKEYQGLDRQLDKFFDNQQYQTCLNNNSCHTNNRGEHE